MAGSSIEVTCRALALGGTAACEVCGLEWAWKFPLEDGLDERLAALKCQRCGGSAAVDERSLVVEAEVAAGGRPERALWPLHLEGEGGDDD